MNTTEQNAVNPFLGVVEPAQRNWFVRLLRLRNRADAGLGIQALIASRPLHTISGSDVSAVLLRYSISGRPARRVLVEVWESALTRFLVDNKLSDEEATFLRALRVPLGITDREAEAVEAQLIHPKYQQALREVFKDGRVSEAERARLRSLAGDLRLSEGVRQSLLAPVARQALSAAADARISDERLSPDEEEALSELAKEFGVALSLDGTQRQRMDRAARFWRIENDEPPTLQVPITLQKNEKCHFTCQASWHEIRTRTVRVNYSGLSTSIRICKGVRYRVGSITPQRVTRDELTHIDDGTLYVTNKRVLFDGLRKNSAIRYSALLSFSVHSDGIILEKATGKSPHLILDGDVTEAAIVLGAVMGND